MTRALAFLHDARPADYGLRLARLRWRRAVLVDRVAEWGPQVSAREALAGADTWVVVRDAAALPASPGGPTPEPPAGRVLLAGPALPVQPPFIHTLRELEAARLEDGPDLDPAGTAALAFRSGDFPAVDEETVKTFLERLLATRSAHARNPAFRAIAFVDPSESERTEVTRRLSGASLRILDSGCGAGSGVAAAKVRHPGWHVTGVEIDPELAARARGPCDRVLEGDLRRVLPELERSGERFDALVFADVLEHLEDPVAALEAGRRIAAPGAVLVSSVPNVSHLSLVRDLICGRFDPTGSGLADVRHLRWFTRPSLSAALAEAGWREVAIEGEGGAAPSDPEALLAFAAAWPERDTESLMTYQWVATAVSREP